jgi:dihydrofolate synthase / folylpolyglutamate synthase
VRYAEALRDLDGRQPESMPGPSLDRIRALTELLDHPELTYPSIQVTGTNGKTTTARAAAALACAHGLAAGTFISPHVRSVTERISVCGQDISEEEFADEYTRLLPYLERVDTAVGPVTYFETLTAMAFLWMADKPVGLGVFEVGMGGTWDATNLVSGDVAVLCPIGLDHVGILGSTVAEIAKEKSGIVKEGRVAVVREQRPEALAVIERRAGEVGARILMEDRDFGLAVRARAVGGQVLTVSGVHGEYEEFFVPVFGEAMARNAAAAVVACEVLLDRALDEGAVRAALESLNSPGRVEVVGRGPLVILDGAHNADAAEALAETLGEFAWERLHLVVGVFGDKDVDAVLRPLVPLASVVYACRSSSPRAADPDRVAAAAASLGAGAVEEHDTVASAVEAARAGAGAKDLILVTGSFYTVADARPLFVPD